MTLPTSHPLWDASTTFIQIYFVGSFLDLSERETKCLVRLLGQQSIVSWQREHQLTLHCLPTSRNTRRPPTWQPCPVRLVGASEECHWQLSITQPAGGNATQQPESLDFISSLTSFSCLWNPSCCPEYEINEADKVFREERFWGIGAGSERQGC